jgi:hypothetical protein
LLIVYRQATISLAGLAIDPANFLLSLRRSPAGMGSKQVCSNSVEEFQSTDECDGTNGSRCAGDQK